MTILAAASQMMSWGDITKKYTIHTHTNEGFFFLMEICGLTTDFSKSIRKTKFLTVKAKDSYTIDYGRVALCELALVSSAYLL